MKKQRNQPRVNNITDLFSKGVEHAKVLPTGKPKFRSVYQYGPVKIITYIFKSGEVFKRFFFRNVNTLVRLKPEIINDLGEFYK